MASETPATTTTNSDDNNNNVPAAVGQAEATAATAADAAAAAAATLFQTGDTTPFNMEDAQAVASITTTTPESFICRICGKGTSQEDNRRRLVVRFLPAATVLPEVSGVTTWNQDIVLHVFCGKTASILPTVNQPDLEILTKAGVKNKHGIGPEVNAALARTRCATVTSAAGSSAAAAVTPTFKEKEFYLIKEFEAHLQAIRSASSSTRPYHHHAEQQQSSTASFTQYHEEKQLPHKVGQSYTKPARRTTPTAPSPTQDQHDWALHHAVAVAAGDAALHPFATNSLMDDLTPDGKIRCGCGGVHLPTGTPKGAQSWRSHVMTKRHQKWMEENGMLGAV